MEEKRTVLNRIACRFLVSLATLAAAVVLAAPAPASVALDILRPEKLPATTDQERISVVGRTDPGVVTTATVGGVGVPVFRNGVFVRDHIPLQMGKNTIPVVVSMPDGTQRNERDVEVVRVAPKAPESKVLPARPLTIDSRSVEPSQNLALSPGDLLEVSFRGSARNRASFQIGAQPWTPMQEVLDPQTGEPTGLYRATVTAPSDPEATGTDSTSQGVTVRLEAVPAPGERNAPEPALAQSKGRVTIWPEGAPVHLLRVSEPVGRILYGLTDVRLGGPYLAELPRGTVLRAVGRKGPHYRVELVPGLKAWIHASEVEAAPPGTAVPHLEFTGMNVISNELGDVITIPYAAPVPFAVESANGPGGLPELNIDLYGAHKAATWLVHRDPVVVGRLALEQPATNHLRVRAELTSAPLWGYKSEVSTSALTVTIRRPPKLAPPPASPLSGLTVAVNAGHGGRQSGATGLLGTRESDLTLAISKALEKELSAAGARVVMTRSRDVAVGMSERVAMALKANADLFVSVHINSSGTASGYLATSGTATFYKHPFNHELADTVRRHVVRRTGLPNFGTVGNFNYSPVRMLTWMPAVLVETAFISNPGEEALMTDPAFQKEMAVAIREALEEYVGKARPGE